MKRWICLLLVAVMMASSLGMADGALSGDEVLALQQRLIALGYLNGIADGYFGGQTQGAVQALQNAHGLEATGAITEKETAAIDEDIRVQAGRAIAVAMTNCQSTDVFTDDGNTYDASKFHDYTYTTGLHAKVVSEGEWTETGPDTWHVEDIRLKLIGADDLYMKLTLDVSFTGDSYVLSGVARTMGALADLDSGDMSKLAVDEMEPSESAPYLTVSPAMLDVSPILPAGITIEHDTARLASVTVDHDGVNDNMTTLVYFGGYRYPEYILTRRPDGDTNFELFPVDGRVYAETGKGVGFTHRATYQYNDDHRLVYQTYDVLDEDQTIPGDVSAYEYDSQGRRSAMDWAPGRTDDAEVKYSLRYTYTYDENDLLSREDRTSYLTGNLVRTDEYQYSEQGEQTGSTTKLFDETGNLDSVLVTKIQKFDVPVLSVRYCEQYNSGAPNAEPASTLYMSLNDPYGDEILEYSLQGNSIGLSLNANGYLVKAVDHNGTEIAFQYEDQPSDAAQEIEVTADTSYAAEARSAIEEAIAGAVAQEVATPEQGAAPAPSEASTELKTVYVLNTNTYKFHFEGCRATKKMQESNTEYYSGTRGEILQMGYSPCGICNP